MYPNQEVERHHVVTNTPGERREVITETSQSDPHEFSLSPGVIATIALLAIIAIGLTYYVVSNQNANEEANRQAMLEANQNKEQTPPPAVVPPAQQPVIIQQPAPAQQAPVIVQQPSQPSAQSASPLDDTTIQDAAAKRLMDDTDLTMVSVVVISGKALLTGTVNTADLKRKAETVVKGVQGVKSVENKIEVSQ